MEPITKSILTEKHFKAIGMVVAEWSFVETYAELLIWKLAGLNNLKGCSITTHVPSETRLNMVATLAEHGMLPVALKNRVHSLINRIRSLREKRNRIVHALWRSSRSKPQIPLMAALGSKRARKPTPMTFRVKAKGEIIFTEIPYTSRQILDVAGEITQLVRDLGRLEYDLDEAKGLATH